MLARGLFALHARYGRRPFDSLTVLRRAGAPGSASPVSRAFARDIAVVAGPLAGDPAGAGDLPAAERPAARRGHDAGAARPRRHAGADAGGRGGRPVCRRARPQAGRCRRAGRRRADGRRPARQPAALRAGAGGRCAARRPGGVPAAAGRWRAGRRRRRSSVLLAAPGDSKAAQDRALAVAAAWRAQGGQGDPEALLAGPLPAATLPPLPASTSFVTLDRDGHAVACAFTHEQPVRHRPHRARHRRAAGRLAGLDAAAAARRRAGLEPQHPRIPCRRRRLRAGGRAAGRRRCAGAGAA